jgi:hypothetical protein
VPVLSVVIALLAAPTPVSSYGGRVAFSEQLSSGRFALVTHTADGTQPVPIPTRRVPFDVELGPTAGHHVAAVYSRCKHDPPAGQSFGAPALYERGRGCDVYEYDFATQREQRLAAASSPVASESWPTLWRGELAFERTYDAHRRAPLLYVRRLGSSAPSRRLPTGPRRGCEPPGAPSRACGDALLSHATGTDLRGRRLAFGWTFGGPDEGLETQVRIDGLGGATRVVAHEAGGGLSHPVVGSPSIDGAFVLWLGSCWGDPGGCAHRSAIFRQELTGGHIDRVAQAPNVDWLSADRGRVDVLRDPTAQGNCTNDPPDGPECRLVEIAPF